MGGLRPKGTKGRAKEREKRRKRLWLVIRGSSSGIGKIMRTHVIAIIVPPTWNY
jgi:hypothetical protein